MSPGFRIAQVFHLSAVDCLQRLIALKFLQQSPDGRQLARVIIESVSEVLKMRNLRFSIRDGASENTKAIELTRAVFSDIS